MKTIKYKIIKSTLLVGLLALFGCNEFLDQLPDNRTEINSAETIENLLVTAYPDISYILMAEMMSDNVTDLGPSYQSSNIWYEDLYRWEPAIADQQDSPTGYWAACYAAVAAANHALAAIEELGSPEELNPHRGEALLCRAYSQFMLVNFFAQHYNPNTADTELGIPYPTKPENTVIAEYKRETVAKVYELLEKDITEGLSLISNALYTVPKFHFTVQAANAFASRFYLFKGDWNKTIEHANIALGDNAAGYMRDWPSYDLMSPAEFLERYTRSTDNANLLMIGAASWWARVNWRDRFGMTVEKRDDFYGYVYGEHPWGGGVADDAGNIINTGSYAMKNIYTIGADLWFTPKWDEKFKYSYAGANTGIGYIMQYAFTGEEVLLNRAEAYIMAGNVAEGIADLNLWVNTHCPYPGSIPEHLDEYYEHNPHSELHTWYTIPEENKLLIQSVIDIRRREFAHDGMRWFDIKRFNFEIEHQILGGETLVLAPNDYRRAVQIPQDAINNGIEPNPREPMDVNADKDFVKGYQNINPILPIDTIN